MLGPADLQNLFYSLRLTTPDIEKAEGSSGTSDVDLRARKVLEMWRQRNGKQATRERVLQALGACENKNARDKLEQIWNTEGMAAHF